MELTVTAEVDATEMFADESADWRYCVAFATFQHMDACEFIIHCGEPAHVTSRCDDMKDSGCSDAFVQAYRNAAERGAIRVLFYA